MRLVWPGAACRLDLGLLVSIILGVVGAESLAREQLLAVVAAQAAVIEEQAGRIESLAAQWLT